MTDHWPLFTEFCRQELASGGPDPQVTMMKAFGEQPDNETGEPHSDADKVWLAGCYGAHHCVPSAYLTWSNVPMHIAIEEPTTLETFLDGHWYSLPVRPEMKSHRMLWKRAQCLHDFAVYAKSEVWKTGDYMTLWDDSQSKVKFFGRYMGIKFLEILRRTVRPDLEMPDLRAKGAWSPRRTLAMLFPDSEILPQKDDWSAHAVETMNIFAEKAQDLLQSGGVNVTLFQLQVMLCEYREALNSGYYPGASLDEEMEYIDKAEEGFEKDEFLNIWKARADNFPHEYLGEFGGWNGLRPHMYQPFQGVVDGRA